MILSQICDLFFTGSLDAIVSDLKMVCSDPRIYTCGSKNYEV